MLEKLLNSQLRAKMLKVFFDNKENFFYLSKLSRKLNYSSKRIKQELNELEKMEIIESFKSIPVNITYSSDKEKKIGSKFKPSKYYKVNKNSFFYPELKSLVLKNEILLQKKMIKKLAKIKDVNYLILSGMFSKVKSPIDILIVGDVDRDKTIEAINNFEKSIGKSLNFCIMDQEEFKYRKDVTDKFLYSVLEKDKIIIIDRL